MLNLHVIIHYLFRVKCKMMWLYWGAVPWKFSHKPYIKGSQRNQCKVCGLHDNFFFCLFIESKCSWLFYLLILKSCSISDCSCTYIYLWQQTCNYWPFQEAKYDTLRHPFLFYPESAHINIYLPFLDLFLNHHVANTQTYEYFPPFPAYTNYKAGSYHFSLHIQ